MLTTADFIISFAVLVVTLPGYIWLVYEAFFSPHKGERQ